MARLCASLACASQHPTAHPLLAGQQGAGQQDQPRHQVAKQPFAGAQQQQPAGQTTEDRRGHKQVQATLLSPQVLGLGEGGSQVAGHQRDRVGHIGRYSREADSHQRRKGDQSAAAGDGIDRAGSHGRQSDQQEICQV